MKTRVNSGRTATRISASLIVLVVGAAGLAAAQVGPPTRRGQEKPWEANRRKMQDRIGGLPKEVLDRQDNRKVVVPAIEEAVATALAAAKKAAGPLIDRQSHNGRTIVVPDEHTSIQKAIDAARAGDTVLVKPGTYYELLTLKSDVRLVSDSAGGGDKLATAQGARLELPARALRTILDGSKSKPSKHGIIDFELGANRKTIVDGFTIQNLPKQNHHIPGHAHALNIRGSSPVITNCLIRNNGSTGIGHHVVYHDQSNPIATRDFRWANIKHQASPVIYNNILHGNLGLGLGCNHFASPFILGNDVFDNDDSELGEAPTPGIGGQHGSFATIIGNIVHDNPGGGILCKAGEPQGTHPIDRPTHPTISKNVVYDNGVSAPGIASGAGGSENTPLRIEGNFVYNAGATGIAVSRGATAIITDNIVAGSKMPGIAVNGSTALKLNGNKVTGVKQGPGFMLVAGALIREMTGNAADSNAGPRFMARDAKFGARAGAQPAP